MQIVDAFSVMLCVPLLCPSGPCEACVSSTTVPRGGTHADGLNYVGRLEVWAGAENAAFKIYVIF